MRRSLAFALVLAAACRGGGDKKAAPVAGRDAGTLDAAPLPPPDLSFVRGHLHVAVERAPLASVVLELAPGGAWRALDGGGANLFPTGVRWNGGALLIATTGGDDDHQEQLAVEQGGKVTRFGPTARMVRNPVVAGGALVVETSEHNFRDLYRLDDAGTVARLTDNREGNFEPALSPDGRVLAFASSRDGDSEIYRMAPAGGAATRLTAFHKDDWSPAWLAGGAALVFVSDREGPPRLFVMKPDSTGLHRLTAETDPEVTEDLPRPSPDGKRLAFTVSHGVQQAVMVMDAAGGAATRVTPPDAADLDLAWSPDGDYLAVLRHPLAGKELGPGVLTFVRTDDGSVVATDPRVEPISVRWSAP